MRKGVLVDSDAVVNIVIAFITIGINIALTMWNWRRRPAVHWFMDIAHNDIPEAEQLFSSYSRTTERATPITIAITNNGEVQARGVKLYSYNCKILKLANGEKNVDRITVLPFIRERSTFYLLLEAEYSATYGIHREFDAYLRIYWADTGFRGPKYRKQDFTWRIDSDNGIVPCQLSTSGPQDVSNSEYQAGHPIIDEARVRGFIVG